MSNPNATAYGAKGFFIMDGRYPEDRDRALVLETRPMIDDCAAELAASYGECVIVDAGNGDWWTLIGVTGDVEGWSDELDELIEAQAQRGFDLFGNALPGLEASQTEASATGAAPEGEGE